MRLRRLALFDLDHTLLPIDTDVAWGEFICDRGYVDAAAYRAANAAFAEDYRAGRLDIEAFLAFGLAPLAAQPRQVLEQWHSEFMDAVIGPAIRKEAIDLVKSHHDGQTLLAVVTATNAFITREVVRCFGIEHLIATIPEQRAGRFTGQYAGVPSYRHGKVTRVEAWLETLGLSLASFEDSTFYSDSQNDLPLLERVNSPVATNPDPTLRAIAQERHWRILELFP